jgi:NADH:ubiquinone oxidoreductase subunit 6 (subunit J)
MGIETLLFLGIGAFAVLFAVLMLTTENAVHSALCLIANFGCVAFLFLMLNAPFLAMVQVAVYAGAIMVLFLFVIMLLKAEQTSDASTRSFRRLPAAAVILGVTLLTVLALPVIWNHFALPKKETPAPSVRLINVAAFETVDVTLSSPALAQPITVTDLRFGEETEFESLPEGTYRANVTGLIAKVDAATGEIALDPTTNQPVYEAKTIGIDQITLANGTVGTIAVAGQYVPNEQKLLHSVVIPADYKQVGDDKGRVVLFNGFSDEPVSLVDLGPEGKVTTTIRDGSTVLIDRIIAHTAPYMGESVVLTYPKGTYNLALLDGSFNIVKRVTNTPADDAFVIKTDTENLILLVPENANPDNSTVVQIVEGTQAEFGSPKGVGRLLFTDYLLPVNLVGMLLLVALVGVITLSRQDVEKQERRVNVRRKVSRPLVNVISTQTGSDVVGEAPQLPTGDS